MKNVTKRWKEIDFRQIERSVFREQRKIFEAAQAEDIDTTHKLQNRLIRSRHAKLLAVHIVTTANKGRRSAGPDGLKNPSDSQKFKMVDNLHINLTPGPVRREWIPKPGKTEKRPLGIPNLIDRAHQSLIVMALEPQWEARFSDTMSGFRRGRGPHDAIAYTQLCLRKSPRWILDADIEKFFNRIDHEALMAKIDAPEAIRIAVRRILAAEICDDAALITPYEGTPQGGPLSPLLANIAMAGMANHILTRHTEVTGRQGHPPRIVIYADDMIVIHKDRHIVEQSRTWIDEYLANLGLNLSPSKTRTCHTQKATDTADTAGFDFLGVHFQHVSRRGKKGRKGPKEPFLLTTPSKDSQKSLYRDCKDLIKACKPVRKERGRRHHRSTNRKMDKVSLLIVALNRKLRGWANYHRVTNAKDTFSTMDNKIFNLLWKWALRTFQGKRRQWIINNLFSGIETDNQGQPLTRKDGTLRQRKWAFCSPFVTRNEDQKTLAKLADVTVRQHSLIRFGTNYYDGDWTYWQLRQASRYPAIPRAIPVTALRRQKAKCSVCKEKFSKGDTITQERDGRKVTLLHSECSAPSEPSAEYGHE